MDSNPRAANILLLNGLYGDEHSVRDRMVAARSGTVPVRAVQRSNDKHLLRFSRVRNAFGSSIHILFLLELRSSYFVIMVVFDASTLILIAKADLLDLFLTSVNVPVAIPGEVENECCGSKKALDAIIIQKALDESR